MEQRSKMAVVGTAVEIDPVFLKALKLLHSKNPDSLEKLRALRDEVIRQHNQPVPSSSKDKPKEPKSIVHSDKRQNMAVSTSAQKGKSTEKKHEAEIMQVASRKPEPLRTVTVEEAGVETIEIGSDLIETVELSSSSFIEQGSSKKARLQFDVDDVLDEGDLEPRNPIPVDDLMIDWGSVCGICYRDESKIPGNQLVECHECHSLYHQRCHEPRVMDSEVNDPRHVWYCIQCVRKMREMASSASPKSRPSDTMTASKPPAVTGRPAPLLPFKRPSVSEAKPVPSPTTQQSFAIPALSPGALAAKGSTTGSSTSSSQNVAMQSAMKRLQLVKKKAQQRVFNHQQIRIPRR